MLRTGTIPVTLRRVHLIPIFKAGKYPHLASSRRPISLLSTEVKLAESVIYHRIPLGEEDKLAVEQFAKRRERGAEMHLVRLMDFTQRALCRGRLCYLVSYDVAGAFDNVSHTHLMRGLVEFGVDGENRRVIRNWLRLRTFQVRLRLPTGLWYSSIPPISKGLPQGRVLPPLLWLIFFNAVPRKVELARQVADGVEINYRDLLYADDATSHIAADRREVAVEAARKNARVLRETLMEMGLRLNHAKTNALMIDPAYLLGETFQ